MGVIGPGPLTKGGAEELWRFIARTKASADALSRRVPRPERWLPVTITDVDAHANTYSAREDAFAADGTRYAHPNGRTFGPSSFAKIIGIGDGNDSLTTVPAEAWVRHAVTTSSGDFWELDTTCKCLGGASGSGGGGGDGYTWVCCPDKTIPNTLDLTMSVFTTIGGITTLVETVNTTMEFGQYQRCSSGPVRDGWRGTATFTACSPDLTIDLQMFPNAATGLPCFLDLCMIASRVGEPTYTQTVGSYTAPTNGFGQFVEPQCLADFEIVKARELLPGFYAACNEYSFVITEP